MAKKQSPSTLLWFIRRRSYVPVCELRRRFELDGEEGTFIDGDEGRRVFIGLPDNSAAAVTKLWRQGKIGLDYSVEFDCRVVIGVYPMIPLRDSEVAPPARTRKLANSDPSEASVVAAVFSPPTAVDVVTADAPPSAELRAGE